MKKTILSILEQHQKIVKHFLTLQDEMQAMAEMITLIGLDIEDLKRSLQEKDKNNTLHINDVH